MCVVPLESGGRAKVNTQLAFQEDDVEELRAFYKDVVQWFDENMERLTWCYVLLIC